MRYTLGLLLLLVTQSMSAQNLFGFWKNIDDEDGKAKSIIEIYEEEGRVHAKVVKLLEAATLTHCHKCKGENKDIEGMKIMWDLQLENERREKAKSGKILDPKKGKVYDCKIELKKEGELKVRGYIKSPVFGRSQTWYRTDAPVQ